MKRVQYPNIETTEAYDTLIAWGMTPSQAARTLWKMVFDVERMILNGADSVPEPQQKHKI